MHMLHNRWNTLASRPFIWRAAVTLLSLAAMTPSAQHTYAVNYTWDASGGTPLDDGSGTWTSTGGTNWFTGTTYGAWGNTTSDVAFFGVGNGAAATVTVSGSVTTNGLTFNAAGSGNYTLSGGTIGLGGTTPTITVNAAGTTTIGSVLTGTVGMVKSGTGTLSLTGLSSSTASNYSSSTVIGQGTLAITSTGTAALSGQLLLGGSAAATDTVNLDLTNASARFGALTVRTNSTGTNLITIGSGQTLTTSGNVSLGPNAVSTTNLTVAGASAGVGTWAVSSTASGATFQLNMTSDAAGRGSKVTVDLSTLGAFTLNYSATNSQLRLGSNGSNQSIDGSSTLTLAASSTITVGRIGVFTDSQNNGTYTLNLGGGVQQLNTDLLEIHRGGRGNAVVQFAGATGSVILRAQNGSGRANISMINNVGPSTGTVFSSTLNLTGHEADLLVGTLAMMNLSNSGANYTSTFSFDQGTLDVTTLTMAARSGGSSGTPSATVNLGSGSNLVNTSTIGTIAMASNSNTAGAISATLNIAGANTTVTSTGAWTVASVSAASASTSTATGAVNISGGTVNATTGIVLRSGSGFGTANGTLSITGGSLVSGGNITAAGSFGGGAATLTLNGGSLNMGGFAIGGSGQTVTTNFQSGTLSNVGEINSGVGLQKTTAGTLVLAGSNAYTGGNQIDGGTLRLATANALGSAANALTLSSGTLDLSGQNATVGLLTGSAGTVIRSSVAGSAVLTANSASSSTFAGQIINGSGIVGLSKQGAGSLTLSATNTYTGPTLIGGGTLALSTGASLASSLITVGTAALSTSAYLDVSALSSGLTLAPNQTINGRGTILGNMVVGGGATVSPGNSTGLLTQTGAVTFASGGRYTLEINNAIGTAGSSSGWDLFDVGSLSITASSINPFSVDLVTLTSAQTPGLADNFDSHGTYYWLFLDAGSAITTWDATAFQVNATGFQNPTSNLFTVVRGDASGVGGTDQQLYVAYIGVPEPGSLALAGVGIVAAGWTLYRRRRRQAGEAVARQA